MIIIVCEWVEDRRHIRSMKSSCLRIRLCFLFGASTSTECNISSALKMKIIEIVVGVMGHLFTYRDFFECSDIKVLHGVILNREGAINGFHGRSVNAGDRAL